MSWARVARNVHFLDAKNYEVAGFWQNGTVIWDDILEWIHLVFTDPMSEYALFRCLEDDPQDPAGKHGPPILLASNKLIVDAGYYVVLSYDG